MTVVGVVGHRGFIGRAVARAVTRHDLTLRPIELRVEVDGQDDPGRAVEEWRRREPGWQHLVEQLRGVEVVVNAAGAADPDSTDQRSLWPANVALPAIVAAACAEAGVDRMVHISSAAVQGPGPLDDTPRSAPLSAYARSKAEAERVLAARHRGEPPVVVIYRPTSVMGPERVTTQRLRRRCAGWVPVARGDAPLPLAHADNVGDAAVFLATVDDPPAIATHPWEGVTVADVVRWSGGRARRIPAPITLAGLTILRTAARARPSLRGELSRVELFLEGQEIRASALTGRGWVPLAPKERYAEMFSTPPRSGAVPLRSVGR